MMSRAVRFLTDTNQFLSDWVNLGQDTCHRTHDYDEQPCYEDCKRRENSKFAQDCKKGGGLYKCCIR